VRRSTVWHARGSPTSRPHRLDPLTTDRLLRRAIAQRRLLSFTLDGCNRIAEPHDYGIHHGVPRLFFYQTGGTSRSGAALGWRWATLAKISQLQMLDATFPGAREVPSGRHVTWDTLYASVAPRAKDASARKPVSR
jgi:hypothetical protein